MTQAERSRKEIREIANARLNVERQKLAQKRQEAYAENVPVKIPAALRAAMKTHAQLVADLKLAENAVRDQAALAGLDFCSVYEGYKESNLRESNHSPRKKAITEEYNAAILKLDEAYVAFNETLALAFSPTEFKTAFEDFCKAIKP